jgi:hypothetical protein
MMFTIVTHAIAFLAGGGGVFIYLHKHQTAAIAAATTLASTVADAKSALDAAKSKV